MGENSSFLAQKCQISNNLLDIQQVQSRLSNFQITCIQWGGTHQELAGFG